MLNPHVLQRLAGLRSILNGVHLSGRGMSAASKGSERENFINHFLALVFPPIYRFGSGDITGIFGAKTGQLDVVVEHPVAPSLPLVASGQTRLYLAESVAVVIEVKSNLADQWDEVLHTADGPAPIRKSFTSIRTPTSTVVSSGGFQHRRIPLIAVGYTGWRKAETLRQKLTDARHVDAALIIDQGIYLSKMGTAASGDLCLWGIVDAIHNFTNELQGAEFNLAAYVTGEG